MAHEHNPKDLIDSFLHCLSSHHVNLDPSNVEIPENLRLHIAQAIDDLPPWVSPLTRSFLLISLLDGPWLSPQNLSSLKESDASPPLFLSSADIDTLLDQIGEGQRLLLEDDLSPAQALMAESALFSSEPEIHISGNGIPLLAAPQDNLWPKDKRRPSAAIRKAKRLHKEAPFTPKSIPAIFTRLRFDEKGVNTADHQKNPPQDASLSSITVGDTPVLAQRDHTLNQDIAAALRWSGSHKLGHPATDDRGRRRKPIVPWPPRRTPPEAAPPAPSSIGMQESQLHGEEAPKKRAFGQLKAPSPTVMALLERLEKMEVEATPSVSTEQCPETLDVITDAKKRLIDVIDGPTHALEDTPARPPIAPREDNSQTILQHLGVSKAEQNARRRQALRRQIQSSPQSKDRLNPIVEYALSQLTQLKTQSPSDISGNNQDRGHLNGEEIDVPNR